MTNERSHVVRYLRRVAETDTEDERIDLLAKAGALIAAEIDRLIRRRKGLEG